jgi:2'-5' RNA ligase
MGKRNVRKLTFRPPLPRRAIVWFPQFEDDKAAQRIANFRREHDPLADTIDSHLAVVFPFHANLTVAQLASHIKRSTFGWPVLPVTFRGVESVQSEFILLMCDLRKEAITELHDRLYRGVLKPFLREDISYTPHLTLARGRAGVGGAASFEAKLAEAELYFRESYRATLRELSIITLVDDGTIVVEQTIPLDVI